MIRNPHVSFLVNGKLLDLWEMRKRSVKSTKDYMYEVNKLWTPNQIEYKSLEWVNYFFESRTNTGRNSSNIIYIPSLLNHFKKEPILQIPYLEMDPQEIIIHHKVPISMGGTDDYTNLVMLGPTSHKLIHKNDLRLKDLPIYINLNQLNKYRKLCGFDKLK